MDGYDFNWRAELLRGFPNLFERRPQPAFDDGFSQYINQLTKGSLNYPPMEWDRVGNERMYQQMGGHITAPENLDPIFEEASRQYGIDTRVLKAIAKQESNFQPNIRSKAGAMGIMQLMPDTAKEMGVRNPYDPRENILGGAKYFSRMLQMFNNDMDLALAAYNAGPGNVKKYGGIPPFKETQHYVRKIRNGYAINNALKQMNYR